jgi:hypothetical protein
VPYSSLCRLQRPRAATDEFAERGLDASVADIARRAGIGKGTVSGTTAAVLVAFALGATGIKSLLDYGDLIVAVPTAFGAGGVWLHGALKRARSEQGMLLSPMPAVAAPGSGRYAGLDTASRALSEFRRSGLPAGGDAEPDQLNQERAGQGESEGEPHAHGLQETGGQEAERRESHQSVGNSPQ